MLGFEGLYEKNWKTVKKKIKIFHFFNNNIIFGL